MTATQAERPDRYKWTALAAASWLRGGKYIHREDDPTGPFGAPEDPDAAPGDAPDSEEWVPA